MGSLYARLYWRFDGRSLGTENNLQARNRINKLRTLFPIEQWLERSEIHPNRTRPNLVVSRVLPNSWLGSHSLTLTK